MKELLADNQAGKPGYEGVLNGRAETIATLLQAAGITDRRKGERRRSLALAPAPITDK